jgi:hypothetical protein
LGTFFDLLNLVQTDFADVQRFIGESKNNMIGDERTPEIE